MSRNRSAPTSRSEPSRQFPGQVERSTPAAVHSPRRGLIGASTQLHRTPVALVVSSSGERTIYPIDKGMITMHSKSTNPFSNEQKDSIVAGGEHSTAEEALQKYASKKRRAHQQRRRKLLTKANQKSAKIILTQRSSARPTMRAIEQRSASSQTDPGVSSLSRIPESVGDATGAPSRGLELLARSCDGGAKLAGGEIAFRKNKLRGTGSDNFLNQFMPESLKMLTSFGVMIILIFWITSVVLDIDVPTDLFRIAANYLRTFTWGHYRKQPQSNVEKCLEYIKNIFN